MLEGAGPPITSPSGAVTAKMDKSAQRADYNTRLTPPGITPMSHLLDVKGLACPLPVLRARKAMKSLTSGEVLEVLATDPGAVEDFKIFCQVTGHALLSSSEAGGVYRFEIRKSA